MKENAHIFTCIPSLEDNIFAPLILFVAFIKKRFRIFRRGELGRSFGGSDNFKVLSLIQDENI